MTKQVAMTELLANVELAALMPRLAAHEELDVQELQESAAQSDAAQQCGDYKTAIEAAQALLVGLVRGLSLELRRSPDESVDDFRARKITPRNFPKSCRFLVHRRFLLQREMKNIKRVCAAATVPNAAGGTSLEAWSRVARQMVFTAVQHIAARYDEWKAGCSCSPSGSVEIIEIVPAGGSPAYEQAICQRCRCPRGRVVEPRGVERVELPAAVCEALRGLGKRELLLVCAQNG